ncbi:MAG: KGG domain-containing protein [Candidatus Doudnabacteria bacterium]
MDQQDRKNPRGFASLSVERRRELGSKGGPRGAREGHCV